MLERGVWVYTYQGGTPLSREPQAPSLAAGGTDGVQSGRGICSVDSRLLGAIGDLPPPLHLQWAFGLFAVPFWQGRQQIVGYSRTIAGCLWITAFMFLCRRISNPHFLTFWISPWGFCIWYWVSSIMACEYPAFGHIQEKAHIGLFYLYLISMHCNSSRHVENVPEIVYCLYNGIWLLPLPYQLQ